MDDGGGGDGSGGASGGGDCDGSGQQLGAIVSVAGSSPHLAKMADDCVNRNMTNIRKFGFSEYVCETEKIRKIKI